MTPICRVCRKTKYHKEHDPALETHPFDPMPESGRIGMAESQNRNQLGDEVMERVTFPTICPDCHLDRQRAVCRCLLYAEIRDLKERLKKEKDETDRLVSELYHAGWEIYDLKERLEKAKEVFKSPAVGCGNSCRTCRETLTDLGKILFEEIRK